MNQIEKQLRSGVKKVISSFSHTSSPGNTANFKSHKHNHYFREMCFCLEGSSRYMINGSAFDLAPGSTILIDRWEEHISGYLPDDNNLYHLWVQANEDSGMRAFFVKVGLHGVCHNEHQVIKIADEYMQILNHRWDMMFADKVHHSPEMTQKYMAGIVNAILDEVIIQFSRNENIEKQEGDQLVESLKQYILSSNGKGCSLKNLEKFSGYNRFYLSHRFKQQEGISIGNYIDNIRIAYTTAALHHGYKQKEIAAELGFSSAANFWNWMKKHHESITGIDSVRSK